MEIYLPKRNNCGTKCGSKGLLNVFMLLINIAKLGTLSFNNSKNVSLEPHREPQHYKCGSIYGSTLFGFHIK